MAQKEGKDKMEDQGAASRGNDQRQGERPPDSSSRGKANTPASSGRYQGSSGISREDEDLISVSSQAEKTASDIEQLREEELSGTEDVTIESANYSDTDEDEDEGLGDGNLGRSVRGR